MLLLYKYECINDQMLCIFTAIFPKVPCCAPHWRHTHPGRYRIQSLSDSGNHDTEEQCNITRYLSKCVQFNLAWFWWFVNNSYLHENLDFSYLLVLVSAVASFSIIVFISNTLYRFISTDTNMIVCEHHNQISMK